jgi:cytidylate kinase
MKVSNFVSPISTIGLVREKLVALQQEMGKNKELVMDGRDIGTVVFPNAELKIFLTASAEVRAKRRYDELLNKGQNPNLKEIYENVVSRDKIDSGRANSPLRKAEDAIELDNSNMTVYDQYIWAKNLILEKFGK